MAEMTPERIKQLRALCEKVEASEAEPMYEVPSSVLHRARDLRAALLEALNEVERLRAENAAVREALGWYAEKAAAIAKYMEGPYATDPVFAVLTELQIDAGRRGSRVKGTSA